MLPTIVRRLGILHSFVILVGLALPAAVPAQGVSLGVELSEDYRLSWDADALHVAGKLAEALPLYEQALAIQEEALAPGDSRLAQTLEQLGIVHHKREDFRGLRCSSDAPLPLG